MNKKLMILGASILQLPAIEKAKEMGLDVVVVDMNPDAVGFKVPGIEKEIYMVMENINGTVGEYPYTSTWVPELKSMGYRVYLLSNFSDQQLHDSREKLPFIDQADGVLLSFRYKMIKPDDAIYQKLFELFSLKPEECLFFDDKQENIDGAVRNKMNGHVFTSYEDAMNTIKNI